MLKFQFYIKKLAFLIKKFTVYIFLLRYKNTRKILYLLLPPANLRNIGDQAQVVAIKRWFHSNFPEYRVLEFDKDDSYKFTWLMKMLLKKNDLIFLHSGGNLGIRGVWSEGARRIAIKSFPHHKIISLPQTIFFGSSEKGRSELALSKKIYNSHDDLTIIARDSQSYKLANEFFPKCKKLLCPDFVLYLNRDKNDSSVTKSEKILLCFRNDSESALNEQNKALIRADLNKLNKPYNEFDTTLDHEIRAVDREKILEDTLFYFETHKLIITDRLHGVIFSVLTKTPCIVISTVDHKLTASLEWFEKLNYVAYLDDIKKLPSLVTQMLSIKDFSSVDWRALYFENLKDQIMSNVT